MGRDALIATYALVAAVLAAAWGAEPAQRGAALLVRPHARYPVGSAAHHVGGKTRAWLSLLVLMLLTEGLVLMSLPE